MEEHADHRIDPRVLRERFMASLFSIWIYFSFVLGNYSPRALARII